MIELLSHKIDTEVSFVHQQLDDYKRRGLKIFASSSFQSHSIPMLHIISEYDRSIPIYFIDTGFHFPETLLYGDTLQNQLGINLQIVKPQVSKLDLLSKNQKFLFTTNPDYCCHLNKVQPMDQVSQSFDVWITGVRKDQSKHRSGLDYEAKGTNGILRFHPMINWNDKMINVYISRNNLPAHPLEKLGYKSVGCEPCTGKPTFDERSGRWVGMQKTECGLHLNIEK